MKRRNLRNLVVFSISYNGTANGTTTEPAELGNGNYREAVPVSSAVVPSRVPSQVTESKRQFR